MPRYDQVSRLYRVLRLLDSSVEGFTVSELHALIEADFPCEKRNVYRDLEALESAGFPVIRTPEGKGRNAPIRFRINRTLRIGQALVLEHRELTALYLSRGALAPLQGTPFYDDLQSAFKKVESLFGQAAQEHLARLAQDLKFEPLPRYGLALDSEALEVAQACCQDNKVLLAVYDSVHSREKRLRRLGPHFLYFAKGSVYLVAEDLEDRVVKTFAIPRMTSARKSDKGYRGSKVEPDSYFESSFSLFRGTEPVHVRLAFLRL